VADHFSASSRARQRSSSFSANLRWLTRSSASAASNKWTRVNQVKVNLVPRRASCHDVSGTATADDILDSIRRLLLARDTSYLRPDFAGGESGADDDDTETDDG